MCIDVKIVEEKFLRLRSLLGIIRLSAMAGEELCGEAYGAVTFTIGEIEDTLTRFETDLLGLSGRGPAND